MRQENEQLRANSPKTCDGELASLLDRIGERLATLQTTLSDGLGF